MGAGFSAEDAAYGVNNADPEHWYASVRYVADTYINEYHYDKAAILNRLVEQYGYSEAAAQYALSIIDAERKAAALAQAVDLLLDDSPFDRNGLPVLLVLSYSFTEEEAQYAAEHLAAAAAKRMHDEQQASPGYIYQYLCHWSFSREEALSAVELCSSAAETALLWLDCGVCSKSEVYGRLIDKRGCSEEEARDISDHLVESFGNYLLNDTVTPAWVAGRMSYVGFTEEEIRQFVDSVDWTDRASSFAAECVSNQFYSRAGLILHMVNSGFSEEVAAAAADGTGTDWSAAAKVVAGLYYANYQDARDPDEIARYLADELFTEEEIAYALAQVFGQTM